MEIVTDSYKMCSDRLKVFIPKNFLFHYPLDLGAKLVGILMTCIMVIIGIATAVQIISVKDCDKCSFFAWRNCFGYSVTAFIYAIIMLLLNLWFLWGVCKSKSSVVLSWIVVTSMWLAQTFCLLIVLICMYSVDTNVVAWVICLVFGLMATAILLYGVMVVVAFWMELKNNPPPPAV